MCLTSLGEKRNHDVSKRRRMASITTISWFASRLKLDDRKIIPDGSTKRSVGIVLRVDDKATTQTTQKDSKQPQTDGR